MLKLPQKPAPIDFIGDVNGVQLFIKREDLIHPHISGNKFWKLYYNLNNYLQEKPELPQIITFGGAFSNHISAVAALGDELSIKTLGIIRGEELEAKWRENPTLSFAAENGMDFHFVSRAEYQNKQKITQNLQGEFLDALIIPEGGTNSAAVEGFKHVLNEETARFDYICTAVGTGGTLAGLSKFAEDHQKLLGFAAVKDESLNKTIATLSERKNFKIIDATFGTYGKINDEVVNFINDFYKKYKIPLDPVYTGKMMLSLFKMIEGGEFEPGAKILAIHTGGLQGIAGANQILIKNNRKTIDF